MGDAEIWQWFAYMLVGLVDVALICLAYEVGKHNGVALKEENDLLHEQLDLAMKQVAEMLNIAATSDAKKTARKKAVHV